jgi:demethylspheroidene O-methyltransferase
MVTQTHVSKPSKPNSFDLLQDRIYAIRNRLLRSQKFQRTAAKQWVTRRIAQKRAREVFDLCAGFVYSQILLSCVKLGVFEALRAAPQTAQSLAIKLNLPLSSTERLLDAAVSLKLLERRSGDRFGLGPHGAVIEGNPGIQKMILHHQMLYADLADPISLMRGEISEPKLQAYWAYARADNPRDVSASGVADYSDLMGASQTLVAEDIIAAYPLNRHQRLLDVGGGDGTFLSAVAAQTKSVQLTLFDLPAVADRAAKSFAARGLNARIATVGGSFFTDPLPTGHDVISLVRIIHDHDDGPALEILKAAHKALAPGGTLLIAEPMSDAKNAETVGAAYFGFYLMAMGSGRPRTATEITNMLKTAGFQHVRTVNTPMPLQTGLLIATA